MPVMTTPGWPLPACETYNSGPWIRTTLPPALSRGPARCCLSPRSPISCSRTPLRSAKSSRRTPTCAGRADRRRALHRLRAASQRLRARARARACVAAASPHTLERSVYVWVASLMLIGVCALWQPVPGVVWQLQRPWSLGDARRAGGRRLADARTAAVIDHSELGGTPCASRPGGRDGVSGRQARTAGSAIRSTSGGFCSSSASATMTMTRLVFAVVSSAYILVAIPFEERSMRASSGGAYDATCSRCAGN